VSGARLAVTGLGKRYPNGTRALEGLTLSVDGGEIVAVIGGSGCGKSTLLRILAGLETASDGTATVAGETIRGPHPAIGIVFQEARLLPWLTVAGNVGFGLADRPAEERAARVAAALAKVGLAGYGSRWPRELSGGQAQRVAIARALVVRPAVLLMDEPFSALDAFTRLDLQEHLLEIWADTRPTLVLVTHEIEEALLLADRVVVMRPHPGRVGAVLDVALPRPRAPGSPAFEAAKRAVREALGRSLVHHRPAPGVQEADGRALAAG